MIGSKINIAFVLCFLAASVSAGVGTQVLSEVSPQKDLLVRLDPDSDGLLCLYVLSAY